MTERRRRILTSDEHALWSHVTRHIQPLGRRLPADETDAKPALVPPPPAAGTPTTDATAKAKAANGARQPAKARGEPTPAKPKPVEPTLPPIVPLERRLRQRLSRGTHAIDAVIDLHGMRQHEAHAALRGFLHSAFRKGQRWVLVITGKGGPRRPRDEDDMFGVAERGILKKNVPIWLAEPELRAIVVSFTVAAISHGGEGALYVQLRNPEKVR